MHHRTSGWIIGLALVALLGKPAHGSLPKADTSIEYRFRGGPDVRWRMQRPAAERHAPSSEPWRQAVSDGGTRSAWFGERLVIGVKPGRGFPEAVISRLELRPQRMIRGELGIFQATDVWSAARAAALLAREPDVQLATPIMRRTLALHGRFAPRPNDPYFTEQWHLENRDENGSLVGPDTNPRAAWTTTRGEGVTVAICDDGFETDHPDLRQAANEALHYDFTLDSTTAATYGNHSTAVAGLVAATGNNQIGVTGLAPAARLASWAIFDRFDNIASDERLMDMFQYNIEEVGVQNHSWGNGDVVLTGPSQLEAAAIDNAIDNGRSGRGVLMARSAGNGREIGSNANDDGYANDPRVIAVGAVRKDGLVASYSNPGACVLVAAPSGDTPEGNVYPTTPNIFTTDRSGSSGYNRNSYTNDLADYSFGPAPVGFSGTSASAPQISGLLALILAANTNLTYRDAQQVLIQSSRYFLPSTSDIQTNAAGYRVGHNQGYGVPDAGEAIRLATQWKSRPDLLTASVLNTNVVAIPDNGLKAWITEAGSAERSVECRSALGPHPDSPTGRLPLAYIGLATNELTTNLVGKAALIERGTNFFREKIEFAARAGASFAVIFNHLDGDAIFTPGGTDYAPIPAVMISENEGRGILSSLQTGTAVDAQLRIDDARHDFQVTNAFLCEHVGLRVRANHIVRGDLRITLVSPSGTRSVLQQPNQDIEPGPDGWTFWSVQHFYETSAGTWTATFADEVPTAVGEVLETELIIRGVAIRDTDKDGLDDGWEQQWFTGLGSGPRDDPDQDGRSNAREQILGSNPTHPDDDLRLDFSIYDAGHARLSWPASGLHSFRVFSGEGLDGQKTETAVVPGLFPETEWITPFERGTNHFFRVESLIP